MSRFTQGVICAVFSIITTSLPAKAIRHVPLPISEAVTIGRVERYNSVVLSPDGALLAYVVRRTGPELSLKTEMAPIWTGPEKGMFADLTLWVVGASQPGSPVQIDGGSGSGWAPVWSPNGEWLAFYSTQDGTPRVWLWRRSDGFVKRLPAIVRPTFGERVEWTPDAKSIVTTVLPTDVTEAVEALKPRWERAAARQPIDIHRAGPGVDDLAPDPLTPLADLAIIDVQTGSIVRRLVRGKAISQHALSPDGRRIAYVEVQGMRPSTYYRVHTLNVQSMSGDGPLITRALKGNGWAGWLAWSSTGNFLLTSEAEGYLYEGTGECFVQRFPESTHDPVPGPWGRGSCIGWINGRDTLLRVEGDSLVYVAASDGHVQTVARRPAAPAELVEPLSSNRAFDRIVYFLAHRVRDRLATLDAVDLVTGKNTRIRDFPVGTSIDIPIGSPMTTRTKGESAVDTCLIYTKETVKDPPNLWCLPIRIGSTSSEKDNDDRRLTDLNPKISEYEMGDSRLVSWRTTDGNPLDGALLIPPDRFHPPYPLVVLVYGMAAPEYSALVDHFGVNDGRVVHNMQILATRGYAVLRPDHNPTTRSGRERAGVVLPAILKLIDTGIVDADRVGVMGHSNGGIEVMQLITESTIFKAAVSQSAPANGVAWTGVLEGPTVEYGQGDVQQVKHGTELIPGDFYTMRERFIEDASPAFYFDRVETPLLNILGTSDEVVPQFLGDEIFVRLRALKKPVEYVTYRDEGHDYDWWSYKNQIDQWTRVIAWFEQYMRSE